MEKNWTCFLVWHKSPAQWMKWDDRPGVHQEIVSI